MIIRFDRQKLILFEDHGLVLVHEYPVFKYQSERLVQYGSLYFLACQDHIPGGKGMIDGNDLLSDDGTFIQLIGDEMSGGADQLDSPLKSLPVRTGPGKGRQKRMMNIDDPHGECRHCIGR